MGVALSITAFPVLARILAEVKLLTTRLGATAMAAAAFNDVAAWVLLALAVALAGSGDNAGLVSLWVLLSGAAFLAFMLLAVRPLMEWLTRRYSTVDEAFVCATLAGVMVSGFITDAIGIHSIFGAFVFGLTVPKNGELSARLIERIEDFVTGLLLPLYFAFSGLKTNIGQIHVARAWGLLALVISTACLGKIVGTFSVAMLLRVPPQGLPRPALLMNTKGLVELIVLNIGREKKVLNEEIFAILVLMALFTTFITAPAVVAIYKPSQQDASVTTHRKLSNVADELRILACVHGPDNAAALISLVESTHSTNKAALVKLFIMHLVELTERSSSILMVQRVRKNGLLLFNRSRRAQWHDRVSAAFQAYGQLGRVSVLPSTAISSLSTMHEDVCQAAQNKRVAVILLPFHAGHGWRAVNQRVLRHAPCSVAVLIDRGLGNCGVHTPGPNSTTVTQQVCVVFFGGPDDREALELGGRMAEHPAVRVMAVRFVEKERPEGEGVVLHPAPTKSPDVSYSFSTAKMNREQEKELDETALAEFRSKWDGAAEYTERKASNLFEGVLLIGRSREHDLMIVGKGRFPSQMVAELAERHTEHPELGPIRDVLAESGNGVMCSVLVIQQHDLAHSEEVPVSKVLNTDSSTDVSNHAV